MSSARQDTIPPAKLDEDGKVADTGPVLDVGGSSIDDERRGTGEPEEPSRAAPPETELPPD
ncbi:hypothetical protein ACWPM1_09590 [Tsuneonella sp. HG249]